MTQKVFWEQPYLKSLKTRIDFKWNESITPLLPEISSEAEFIILKDYIIHSSYSDGKNEKIFWEVEGFASVPCGGTHLKKTGEIGKLKLKRKNIGKGKERVEIFLKSASHYSGN